MNFSNPTLVEIKISSPVTDFKTPAGWESEVTINLLPPYDNDPDGIMLAVTTALGTVGCCPLDNMADMEYAWHWASDMYVEQQGALTSKLKQLLIDCDESDTELKVEYVTELFTMSISVVEREDVFAKLDDVNLGPITEELTPPTPPPMVTVIAAMNACDYVIGRGAEIPWTLPEDQAQFKLDTMGHAIVCGRKTLDSIGRLLPGRTTIVITRDPETRERLRSKYGRELIILDSLHRAITYAQDRDLPVDIIGGGEVYHQALDHADRLVLTLVFLGENIEGDDLVKFPSFDINVFQPIASEDFVSSEGVAYTRAVYHRTPK